MSQFHPDFTDATQLKTDARAKGFVDWTAYFSDMGNLEKNPDCPTINAFICAVAFPEPRCLAVRNPYYWKVDPDGNQLPYIDQISYTTVFDSNVLNMKAMDGEIDFQTRHIDAGYYTLFMESRDKAAASENRYRVHIEQSTGVVAVYVNQHSRDDTLRPLLKDPRLRIALSVAINREELIDMCYSGLAEPNNGVATPFDPFYVEGLDKQNIQYDPQLANQLLDEMGLMRDEPGGLRRLPNGEPFHQILHVYPSEAGDTGDMWLLISEYWREIGLRFVVKHEDGTLSGMQVRNGNSDFWAYASAGMHWELDGLWLVPLSQSSYYAPLYGRYYQSNGRAGVKPPPEHQILVDWYHELKGTPSYAHRTELAQRILRYWADKCYLIGICRKPEVFIISERFRNVPDRIIQDYTLMAPGYIGIEQFWIDQTDDLPTSLSRRSP
jgi:peptide/nickel transport system substrate-binding protein